MFAEWRHDINFQSTLVPNFPDVFSQDGGQINNVLQKHSSYEKRRALLTVLLTK